MKWTGWDKKILVGFDIPYQKYFYNKNTSSGIVFVFNEYLAPFRVFIE